MALRVMTSLPLVAMPRHCREGSGYGHGDPTKVILWTVAQAVGGKVCRRHRRVRRLIAEFNVLLDAGKKRQERMYLRWGRVKQ